MSVAVPLVEHFAHGLDAPICLTWELTYACNLACRHCLSSSGRRDPAELSTAEAKAVIDELERMQVFYVNIGGGEPTIRPDFWELVDYATAHHVGVKFSTNGVRITPERAAFLAGTDYVDVQVSLDGATAEVNDYVRGPGSYDMAITALQNLQDAGFSDAKIGPVRVGVGQSLTVELRLSVAGAATQVQVESGVAAVETTRSSVARRCFSMASLRSTSANRTSMVSASR